MNSEFQVHMLNDKGIQEAKDIAAWFDHLLDSLQQRIPSPSRELSLVKTKLEEACFFAKKAIANNPANQKEVP